MDLILIITFGVLIGCLIGISWFAGFDAPYVPTKTTRIRKLLKSIPLKGKTFYELGSGDGRVVRVAAELGAQAIGIEQSLLRILYSRYKSFRQKLANAKFWYGNIFDQNYTDADVVFIFLLPKGVEKLEDKLKKELKKDSLIITQTFHFKKWKPYKKIVIMDKKTPNILLGPDKIEGDFWLYKV